MQLDLDVMREKAGRASQLLAAMSNQKRLMILCQLVEGERSVGEISELLGIRQTTVSQHLALLKKDGFVESRRDAQTQFYSLTGGEARTILEALYGLYCANG
jgi:DNA-binding transcriptional ArsR family regulator